MALAVHSEQEVLEDSPGKFLVCWVLSPLDLGEDRDQLWGIPGADYGW